jgi:translocation and assembly module TamB
LQIQDQVVNGLALRAGIADRVATVTLDSETLGTYVHGEGRVDLSGTYQVDATFDTSTVSLQPLLAMYLPAQSNNITGQTEIHLTARGPLKQPSMLDARVTIPTLSVAYKDSIQLAAAAPVNLHYTNGILTLQPTSVRGTGTDLQLEGVIPINSPAPLSLTATGTIDLRVAELADPDISSSGQLQLNITGSGHRQNPQVQGQIRVVDASFAGDGVPLGLQDGNGVLTLTKDRLTIDTFRGNVGGGVLTARGAITYWPALYFNVSASGN